MLIATTATPGQWIIDSGGAVDIVSPADLAAKQRRRVKDSDGSIVMQTAGGQTAAEGSLDLSDPFGKPIEAYVLPDSPSLISLGPLFCDSVGSQVRLRS